MSGIVVFVATARRAPRSLAAQERGVNVALVTHLGVAATIGCANVCSAPHRLLRPQPALNKEPTMTELVTHASTIELIAACTVVFAALTAGSTLAGFALESALGDSRKIYDLPLADGQLRWELRATVRFVLMAGVTFGLLLAYVPIAEPDFANGALTFGVCWVGFEVYYWGLHRSMHTKRLFRFHKLHHESRVTTPLTGYSMSTVESLGWLLGLAGVPFLLSLVTPISVEGFFLYHALYQVAGNQIGHSNVDFFPAAASNRASSWISHPITYHSLHHARFNNHYSFGSSFMDRLLGTEWADWPELHKRVVSGIAMRKLSERGSSEGAS
jgi:Delta7-sterol 5-desaturase